MFNLHVICVPLHFAFKLIYIQASPKVVLFNIIYTTYTEGFFTSCAPTGVIAVLKAYMLRMGGMKLWLLLLLLGGEEAPLSLISNCSPS